ncbi:conserved hypothetical protein [Caldicellulosiruptor hydrothermalis 108]|uniref:Uncharacterized protein n=1 Tax=Caldicellulosiruptor hydrothermalis (strain DSM 18901 / VKM B-2411 / 108) TaxID=632292 RepID=E4QDS8_CALH1|nr:hypothetical protein [Caldicellulosiruptor hydrothermalis]ADQ06495.1 conserved hypothetical protein [Caldicellulosiruptor hydrothermalis 108]
MQAGYSARCKVCNSPHRAEIEKWIKEEGISIREVTRRLAEKGEKISHEAIRRHIAEHFNVKDSVKEQYKKSQEQFEKLVEKQLSDIEILDSIIQSNFELHRATGAWLKELVNQRSKVSLSLVQLHEKTASEIRQAMKTKQELLGNDPLSNVADVLSVLWSEDDDANSESEGDS